MSSFEILTKILGSQVKQEAAVLVALVDLGGEAGILFNKRSSNLSSHRGQVFLQSLIASGRI